MLGSSRRSPSTWSGHPHRYQSLRPARSSADDPSSDDEDEAASTASAEEVDARTLTGAAKFRYLLLHHSIPKEEFEAGQAMRKPFKVPDLQDYFPVGNRLW